MSAAPFAHPAPDPGHRSAASSPRPKLRLVPAPAPSTHRAAFVALVVVLLSGGLIGLLLLNTLLAQGSFAVHDLQRQLSTLQDDQQSLARAVGADQAPTALAARAAALGMVPAGDPVVRRLPGGQLVAQLEAAPLPTVRQSPPAKSPAAKAKSAPKTKPAAKRSPAVKPAAKTSPVPRPRVTPGPTR
jgi:hypothetical protein